MQATLTVLFTDAVASTEALSRLGDERFGTVQKAHLDLLRSTIGGHGGREIKSMGDGLMVEFKGAADALATAVSMQQAIETHARRGEESLPLRVGLSSGDVTVGDDGDLHGTAVVEAARLCAVAAPGQILTTETVRALAGSRGGHAYTALGPVELKGLAESVPLVEVGWAPLAEADGGFAPVPLPPRLASKPGWSFVGRATEIERLDEMRRQALDRVRVALLAGEPGAGKTRLAREFAVRAHEQGALVLFGRVDEDLAIAYQPFAEALRHYLASVDETVRERVLGSRGGALARLVPELAEEEPLEGQIESWAVFEGLVDWLSVEAGQRPVVLVLDDIHWAAKPTLQALMHLARSERLSRLLIVGTYRDTELDRKHPLAGVLADLRRVEGVERLAIRGLDRDEVAAWVQATSGNVLDRESLELAARLSEQTQGNPFFVGQILRNLSEGGAAQQVEGRRVRAEGSEGLVIPEGVREVIGRRVSRLSEEAGELLTVAAVAGMEFDVAIIVAVAGQPMAEALDGLDEAVAARLVLETESPGKLRFAHALVQQTLEDELSTMRRLHMHQQIGLAMESRFADAEAAVADLAHHFAEAAALGEGERAARYAERAAMQAFERGAPEQAADLLDQALELLPVDADLDGLQRERLYSLMIACLWTTFDLERLEKISYEWLGLAREFDDDVMLLNAAPFVADLFTWVRPPEPEDLRPIREALAVDAESLDLKGRQRVSMRGTWCEHDAPGIRAWLLGKLANDWVFGLPLQMICDALPGRTPLALADEACLAAERSSDHESADDALFFRGWAFLGSPDAESQLECAERLAAMDPAVFVRGRMVQGIALARLGRFDELRTWADEGLPEAERAGDRLLLGTIHAQRALEALACGRLEDAHRACQESLRASPEQASARMNAAVFAVAELLASGRASDALPIAEQLDASPLYDLSHLVGAVAAAKGDADAAGVALDAWQQAGRPLVADFMRSAKLWGYAECAHLADDRGVARLLYEELVPYNGQLLVWAWAFTPASAAFTLGQLAETLGERERAVAHYTEALAFEERTGATTLAERTRKACARLG